VLSTRCDWGDEIKDNKKRRPALRRGEMQAAFWLGNLKETPRKIRKEVER